MAKVTESEEADAQIEVTPAMIEAGLQELHDHSLAGDMNYILESVYRAMAYESSSASATKFVR